MNLEYQEVVSLKPTTSPVAMFRKQRLPMGPLYWPINPAAAAFCHLAGKEALAHDKLLYVRQLGFEVDARESA